MIQKLIVILGDQLTLDNPALAQFNPATDCVWMAEVNHESTKVWSHKVRIVMFLSAMRHFRVALEANGYRVIYHTLDDPDNSGSLEGELQRAIRQYEPQEIHLTEPGEWDIQDVLTRLCRKENIPLHGYEDTHFLCSISEFKNWAKKQNGFRMEFFYRHMREKFSLLMESPGKPAYGAWNFDKQNRGAFGQLGPMGLEAPLAFKPDAITEELIQLVEQFFPDHPGRLEYFDFPVTEVDARLALKDFITHRLPLFGQYQDAMWQGAFSNSPYLAHSRLSAAMNLKLLNPRVVLAETIKALESGHAPVQAVEGFIRQILGWREYVRGIYWLEMPAYRNANYLQASHPLPDFYWTADTEMLCLKNTIRQTLDYGYAHHIQRLMVTGLFALLLGVNPKALHEWYLAIYIDAIEWVELPNTIGMSQYGDGGLLGSKPYIATGKYIDRMSNYCETCVYDPALRVGENACPFTTLYWDFMIRHQGLLQNNQRTQMQVRNLRNVSEAEQNEIQALAAALRDRLAPP